MSNPLPSLLAVLCVAACQGNTEIIAPATASLGTAAASGQAPVAWVNGSFHRPVTGQDDSPDPDLLVSATFNAQLLGDGSVRGNVRIQFHSPDGTLFIDLHEDVTCLDVGGSTAWIGTVAVREHLSAGQPSRLGRPVVWQVRDLGVGQDFAQRRIDFAPCTARPELNLVRTLHGDLHVADRR